MRIVQFCLKNAPMSTRLGVQVNETADFLVDLSQAPEMKEISSTISLIKSPVISNGTVESVVKSGKFRVSSKDVTLVAPINSPDKVICIGMNYVDHCTEQNIPVPKEPVVFNKFPSSLVGPNDDLPYPEVTQELDWEVEMAIIIGKKGKNVSVCDAMDHVFGFTVAHDVSARDWQLKRNGGQWLVGKTMDAFCPIGPAIVTRDEIGDPHNLNLGCLVNGTTMQNSNTNQLVFKTEELISWCSKFFTLLPGDVILTGTPPGVGVFMKPPLFLKKGDVVECFIEKIGKITNKVV